MDSKNLVESTALGNWIIRLEEDLGDGDIINNSREVEISWGYIEIEFLGDILM